MTEQHNVDDPSHSFANGPAQPKRYNLRSRSGGTRVAAKHLKTSCRTRTTPTQGLRLRPSRSSQSSPKIEFLEKLRMTIRAISFKVRYEGELRFMKVFFRSMVDAFDPYDRDWALEPFLCESRAYERMAAHGSNRTGLVAKYYGSVEDLDPQLYRPHLDDFILSREKCRASAILLEFVPDLERLTPLNYRKEHARRWLRALKFAHAHRVRHADIQPRHFCHQRGKDRAIITNFDSASVYPLDVEISHLPEKLQSELSLTRDMLSRIEEDTATGYVDRSFAHYFPDADFQPDDMKAWLETNDLWTAGEGSD